MSEVERNLDLSVLRYSRVDEDYRVLSKALQICPEDIVLSITRYTGFRGLLPDASEYFGSVAGFHYEEMIKACTYNQGERYSYFLQLDDQNSGDNVLNILLERPKKIVAVDMSIAQNSLLELKIAAISHLQYEDYLLLLGEATGDNLSRKTQYDKVKDFLPQYARIYWDSNQHHVMNSLNECGRLQQYLKRHSVIPISKVVSSRTLDELLGADNLIEQRKHFDSLPIQKLKNIVRDVVLDQVSGRSSAQLKHVALSNDEMVEIFWNRFYSMSRNVPNKDNFYYSLFMRGERSGASPTPVELLPPYLTEDGFYKLKGLVDRIEIHTGSIEGYISSSTTQFHKANLSDIFEYMSPEDSDNIFTEVCSKIVPGGYLAYWNLFRDCQNPASNCKATLQVDFSKELQTIDRVFFFKFHVLKIN